MISAIIFSEGNPLRVDALLTSIEKNAKDVFSNGTIVYKSDSQKSDEAYELAKNSEHSFKPFWKKSNNIKEDVVSILESTAEPFVCFFSEGDLIYRNISTEAKEIEKVFEDPQVLSFSTRLGVNTTKCYFVGIDNKLYGQEVDGNVMKFDWQKHYMDFSTPFSMSGTIFRTQEILKMIKKIQFSSALDLEDALYLFQDFPKNKMGAFVTSALVTVPTTEIKLMVKGSKPAPPENHEKTSDAFILGERIDLDSMKFEGINACYADIEYPLKIAVANA